MAQHSVLVANILAEGNMPELGLCGLLHDATEAYLGDIVSPLKAFLPCYREIEQKMWKVIAGKFGLPLEIPGEVKTADRVALGQEKNSPLGLIPATSEDYLYWFDVPGESGRPALIEAWGQNYAKSMFLEHYDLFWAVTGILTGDDDED